MRILKARAVWAPSTLYAILSGISTQIKAADRYRASDANFATHQLNKPARDRQPQSGAAKATCCRRAANGTVCGSAMSR
jgi:hypothetical protein